MIHRSLFVIALVAGCSSPSSPAAPEVRSSRAPAAASPVPSPIARAALASRESRRLAASLADQVGPRLAGSPGDASAVKWAERTMRDLHFANVHREPVTVPVWRRGEDRAQIVSGGQALEVNALGWSGSTPAEGTVSEVLRAATVDELAKMTDDAVRGKIVFVDAAMRRSSDGSGYGEAVGTRYRAQKVAGAKGAVAVLIRSVGTDDLRAHTGSTNREAAPGLPIGALSNGSADVLARAVAAGPVRLHLVMTSARLPDAQSANVVGEIRGSDKPEEVVLLAAHLDSWDTGRGAVDDGAGCGAVLDALRLIATDQPERTVRVVLYAAEENSNAGAKQYAEAHAQELDRIVLAMEVDGGTDRVLSLGFLGDSANAPAFRAIAEPLAPLGVRFSEEKGHAGADVGPLLARGVPVIDVRQDVSRYFDIHHTSGDTSDRLDADALAQVTAVVAHAALGAARSTVVFGRAPAVLRERD